MKQSLSEEAVSRFDEDIKQRVKEIRKRRKETELSTVALQGKLRGTKQYTSNPSNSYKELTEVVLEYKKAPTQQTLQQILRLTEKLIFTVMRQYNMFNFPESITEDIFADCQTFVLLKCLNTYDPAKKAAFSTHYTWWLKSYMNYKRDYHNRREHLYDTTPIQTMEVNEDDVCVGCEPSTFNNTTVSRVKRLMEKGEVLSPFEAEDFE